MLLSQTGEYAIRAMAYLALLKKAEAISAVGLSEATRIPVAYLSKVMRRLAVAGLVTARKGHGGGFALARPAARIRLRDVLQAVGEELQTEHCAFGYDRCDATRPCPLHHTWLSLQRSCSLWAAQTTLGDVRDNTSTAALVRLGLGPPAHRGPKVSRTR